MTILYRILAYLAFVAMCCVVTAVKVHDHDSLVQARAVAAEEMKWAGVTADYQNRLDQANANVRTITQTITKQVPYVTTHIIYRDRVVERPTVYLNAGSVGLFDAAFGLRVPDAASCPDGSFTCVPALAASGTTLDDLYGTLAIDGATCQQAVIEAEGWQQWYNSVAKVKP